MRIAFPSMVALLGACGGSDPASSSDPDGGSFASADSAVADARASEGADTSAPQHDSSPMIDASTDAADVGTTCTPSGGTTNVKAYCDLFELAYFTMDGMAPRSQLLGRISVATPEPACAIVDAVDVQTGGTTIATLGGNPFTPGNERAVIAVGPGFPALAARCSGDANRFGDFGFRIRGRMDGGSFTADCADAEGGSRWPPAVRVTCHKNVDASPLATSATLESGKYSSLPVTAPHGLGGALESVASSMRIIPVVASSFGATPTLAPFDSSGWTATVSESTTPWPSTSIALRNATTPLPAELCPKPGTPGPGYVPPPAFLARITGNGRHGAYSTEVYVSSCSPLP